MSTPTPGPWSVEDRRRAALKNIRIVAGNHEVCEVSDVHQRDDQGGFRGDHKAADAVDAIGLANARLISAAPDLLEALIELREAEINPPLIRHEATRWAEAMRKANAAIHKAQGAP